jgi:hypothetical protein
MMIIANQPIDVTADPPVPPRSDNYLHYTGDVGGALGVRRPHRGAIPNRYRDPTVHA